VSQIEDSARAELAALRREAARVVTAFEARDSRLVAAGAPWYTRREEHRRIVASDRRRATCRTNGTIPLPGDSDYKGRRLAVCLAPMPCAPSLLRVSGKVDVSCVDGAKADSKVNAAIARADGAANALHNARTGRERELISAIHTFAKASGAKRKALLFKIRATLHNDPSLLDAARNAGWHTK
jgi:hypothetical protein